MRQIKLYLSLFLAVVFAACTKLDEEFRDQLEGTEAANVDVANVLRNAYNSLNNPFQDQSRFWAAQQHTSDATVGPTRGPDWDDNGVWRVLHTHEWTPDHGFLRDTYRELLQAQFAAASVLDFNASAQQKAEARFIRALSMFAVLDGWDQVPFRDDLQDLAKFPTILKGTEAADFIIGELNAIMNDLPSNVEEYVANQDAAKALLMKMHLNKGVYANRQQPSFDNADMNQVITLADQIMGSNKYSLEDNYFDNFAPTNDVLSNENIFTLYNENGDRGGNNQSRWFMTLHYNQNPSGWNGFTTLSNFYNMFEPQDIRRGMEYQGVTNVSGLRVGFLVGQQYDKDGVALKDRKGNPLAFTPEVSLVETGDNLEVTGIRVIKYPPDYQFTFPSRNDYVIFRLGDVLLMKAEALFRTGKEAEALAIVNQLRIKRGATPMVSLNAQQLLDERGRELYWEGWRRQDMIRFGKFLEPFQLKPQQDDPKRLLFPIPSEQLAVNPNLEQNPGY